MTVTTITLSCIILAIALVYQSWWTYVVPSTTIPRPTNPLLADISDRFQAFINNDTSSSSSSPSTSSSSSSPSLRILKQGILRRDLDTFLWNKFAEKFGNNPHTPYMYNTLPLFSYFLPLPSPMWRLSDGDAVVLLFERPPPVEYFSFTTYILGSWKRGLVFASLGDSLNSHSPMMMTSTATANNNFFAHVVTTESSSGDTTVLDKLKIALIESGISKEAIYVAVIPNSLTAEEAKTAFYEVNLRLFRFENQTEGDIYLRSNQPVFHVRGLSSSSTSTSRSTTTSASVEDSKKASLLPKPIYKDRYHPNSVDEPKLLQSEIHTYRNYLLANLTQTFNNNAASSSTTSINIQTTQTKTIDFSPLYIIGSKCLDTIGHLCLGDSPDAAYFGSNILPSSDDIQSLILPQDTEFHLVTAVDHRVTKAGIYSSITLLKTNRAVLNKNRLDVRGTSIGALSNNFDYHHHHRHHEDNNNTTTNNDTNNDDYDPFFSWIFTRNPEHCYQTKQFVKGCTVIDEREVSRKTYFAYCERIYMNEVTGTGPDWDTILPARIHHFQNVVVQQQQQQTPSPNENDTQEYKRENAAIFARLQLPSSDVSFKIFEGEERLKFLHIVKTGGESLERYLWNLPPGSTGPFLDYANCRRAAAANLTAFYPPVVGNNNDYISTASNNNANAPCWAIASTIGVILCGLNCECCANDLLTNDETTLEGGGSGGGLHGTLLRSPRSHVLSLFSHGHQAHHTTWKRMASDLPLYAAEGVLRGAEKLCGHSGTDGVSDWKVALEEKLESSLASWPLVSNVDNNHDDLDDVGSSRSSGRSITQVTPLRNPQSHAMTCGKSTHGSVAQHFRVLSSATATITTTDALEPSLDDALATMHRMEWIGLTDLFHPSLCLLHYQFNRTLLEEDCDCRHPRHYTNNGDDDISSTNNKPLGYWKETRSRKRSVDDLSADVVELIDAHTTVDSRLFAAALRLVLGRLRRLEELTGASMLECIDWQKLKRNTDYIPGLWSGPESLLPS